MFAMSDSSDFDLKNALQTMVARSARGAEVSSVMPLERLDKAVFEPSLPWNVRGFITYHRLDAYSRICLENAGMKPKPLWATYQEPLPDDIEAQEDACMALPRPAAQRVRLLSIKGDSIVVSPRGDRDAKTHHVSLTDLSDFGDSR